MKLNRILVLGLCTVLAVFSGVVFGYSSMDEVWSADDDAQDERQQVPLAHAIAVQSAIGDRQPAQVARARIPFPSLATLCTVFAATHEREIEQFGFDRAECIPEHLEMLVKERSWCLGDGQPLVQAVEMDDFDLVACLLRAGRSRSECNAALAVAVERGKVPLIPMLLLASDISLQQVFELVVGNGSLLSVRSVLSLKPPIQANELKTLLRAAASRSDGSSVLKCLIKTFDVFDGVLMRLFFLSRFQNQEVRDCLGEHGVVLPVQEVPAAQAVPVAQGGPVALGGGPVEQNDPRAWRAWGY
jgi:hypothetical protein